MIIIFVNVVIMNIVGAVYLYWVYCIANVDALLNSMPNSVRSDSNGNSGNAERLCTFDNVNA